MLSSEALDAMVLAQCTAEQIVAVVKAEIAKDEERLAEKRANDRERKREERARHVASRDVTRTDEDSTDGADTPLSRPPNEKKSNPPTHTPGDKPRARGAIELPDDWQPKPFGEGTASRKVVDGWPPGRCEREVEHFRAHHQKNGSKFRDWQAAWSTWVLNSEKFGGRQNGTGTGDNRSAIQKAGDLVDEYYARQSHVSAH